VFVHALIFNDFVCTVPGRHFQGSPFPLSPLPKSATARVRVMVKLRVRLRLLTLGMATLGSVTLNRLCRFVLLSFPIIFIVINYC